MIGSPSDVKTERDVARQVIYTWNAVHSESRKIILWPIDSEFDTFPELGERPQGIINRQGLQKSDLLVAIFWTRLGTPTGQAISGTVEEIEEHVKAGKEVMLYFSQAHLDPANVDWQQHQALKEFQEESKRRGLVQTFRDAEDFRGKFSNQLARKINQDRLFTNAQPRAAQLVEKSDVYQNLIDVARRAPGTAIETAWPYVQDSLLALGRKFGLREQGTMETNTQKIHSLRDFAWKRKGVKSNFFRFHCFPRRDRFFVSIQKQLVSNLVSKFIYFVSILS